MASPVLNDISPARHRESRVSRTSQKKGNNIVSLILAGLIVVLLLIGLVRMFAKPPAPATVTVVAAAKDLPPGCRLGFQDLHYLTIPKAYYSADMPTSYADLAGRYTAGFIGRGEPISTVQLLPGKKPLSDQLGTSERAFTLKLNDEGLVDHAIIPGDRVDVITTVAAKDGSKYTKTVCQNVMVLLSASKSMLLSDKLANANANKITLAVTPQAAELLTQAAEVGKVRVVLRNHTNRIFANLDGADDSDLVPANSGRPALPALTSSVFKHIVSDAAKLLPLPPPPQVATTAAATSVLPPLPTALGWVVEVFQGSKKESHEFPVH